MTAIFLLLSENKCGIIFLYNGEYGVSTDENGLYYMRARYYNPEIKRFINQDIVIGSIADSPTLNRYAYVEGNPISLADPFGLSPAINWSGAGHTILGLLGLLTFVPGCQVIGIAANAINAVWYFAEGDIFSGICSGLAILPGLGGVAGKIGSAGKFSNATLMIQRGTQIASSVGFMGIGTYTIGKIGYENYQKYVERGEDFSFWDLVGDTVDGAFAVLCIYGGAKGLGFDKVNVPTKLKGSVYIGGGTSKYSIIKTSTAEEVNEIFKNTMGYDPPYKLGTNVTQIQLKENATFVRVYDKVNSKMKGGWVMKAEDIAGLTPQEIQNKFALPNTPIYVCDVNLEAGTYLRMGEANPIFGFSGGGLQYDLIINSKCVGTFTNERLIGK